MSPFPIFAHVALVLWGLLGVVFFAVMRPVRAALMTVFAFALFAPEGVYFKLPFVPAIDKNVLPYIIGILACILRSPGSLGRAKAGKWFLGVFAVLLFGGIGTTLTNLDPLIFPTMVIPPMSLKDGMLMAFSGVFQSLLPFTLGVMLFRTEKDLSQLMRFLVAAGALYSLFMLFEVRFSPALHFWIYGYQARTDFTQNIRWGGYRPTVFMTHGLAVGLFSAVVVLAAAGLTRAKRRVLGLPGGVVLAYLAVILVLSKSTGAILYGLFAIPLVLVGGPRSQKWTIIVLSLVVLLYPLLRLSQLFPAEDVLSWSKSMSEDRASSLSDRFKNEDQLAAKARERAIFGWGGYSRNMIWPEVGHSLSVVDGQWILCFGSEGVVSFLQLFGLLLYPVFGALRHIKKLRLSSERAMVMGLAIALTISVVDLIPNSLFSNYPCFLAGALQGLTYHFSRGLWDEPEDLPLGPDPGFVDPGNWHDASA
jgi:hypothetical protein